MRAQFDNRGWFGGEMKHRREMGDGENCVTVNPTVVGKRWIRWTGHVIRMGQPKRRAEWDSTTGEFSSKWEDNLRR